MILVTSEDIFNSILNLKMPSKKRRLKLKHFNLKSIIKPISKFFSHLKKLVNLSLISNTIKKTTTGLLICLSITNVVVFPSYLIYNYIQKNYFIPYRFSDVLLSIVFTLYILQILFWISFYFVSLIKEKTTFDFRKSLFNKSFLNYFVYNTLLIGLLFVTLSALVLVFGVNFYISLIIVSVLFFGLLSTIGFLPYFIITENNTLIESLVKSWKFSKLYFYDQLIDLSKIYLVFVLPVSILIIINQFIGDTTSWIISFNYVAGVISFLLLVLVSPKVHYNSFKKLRLRGTYFRTKVSKIKLPQKYNFINKFGSIATLCFGIILITLYVSQMINFVGVNVNASRDSLFNFSDFSRPKEEITKPNYYIDGLNSKLNYDNFEVNFTNFYFLAPQNNNITNLCILSFEILNTRETTLFLPSFQIRLTQNKKQLPVYTDELSLTENQIDPFKLYYLSKDIKLVGEIIYSCPDIESQFLVEFIPSRQIIPSSEVDYIGDLAISKAFETLSNEVDKKTQSQIFLIINVDNIQKVEIENKIPVEIENLTIKKQLEANTLYCIIDFNLKNNHKRQINYQFYHLALIDQDGVLRAHTNFDTIPAPQSYNVNIAPNYSTNIKHAFNCSNDGSEYIIKYQPFENFGVFVNQTVKEIKVTL
jgi:hypothetical protein